MNNISLKDKVAIILDNDPDGFCSGILFQDFCERTGAKTERFIYKRERAKFETFGLDDFNKIIITDIAPGLLNKNLEKIKDKKVLYMDHHPREFDSPKEINEYTTLERGYIPSSRSAFELTKGKKWISLVGTISDAAHLYKENDEFIKEALDEFQMSLEEFKEKVVFVISNFLIYFNKKRSEAYDILRKMNSIEDLSKIEKYSFKIKDEIYKYVNEFEEKNEKIENVNFYYINPKYSIKNSVAFEIGTKKENHDKIFIFASPKKDNKISLSARNTSKKRDMADLLKAGIGNLEGNAGGHAAAAGGLINKKDLEKFKENLQNYLKKSLLK